MDALLDFCKKGQSLTSGEVFQTLMQTPIADELTNYVLTEIQMEQKGQDGTGQAITNKKNGKKKYSRLTEQIYAQSGRFISAGDPYTMKYTGAFHESIKIGSVNSSVANINSQPIKPDGTNLLEVYGDDLLKLTDENADILAEDLVQTCVDVVKEKLGI